MNDEARAQSFRQMHHEGRLLVVPNAWDVPSGRALAALPGCRAIATSSAAVAGALGWEDGEHAPAGEMIRAASRIAAAVTVPVTADLERGYGDPVGTARAAWDAGLVGMNLEDSTGGNLVPLAEQTTAISAVRREVPALVLNARVDVFLSGGTLEEAIARANAYLAAGADCVYPILCPPEAIGQLAEQIAGPVNVLAGAGTPPPRELQRLGIARLTFGAGLAACAYREAARVAGEVLLSASDGS